MFPTRGIVTPGNNTEKAAVPNKISQKPAEDKNFDSVTNYGYREKDAARGSMPCFIRDPSARCLSNIVTVQLSET